MKTTSPMLSEEALDEGVVGEPGGVDDLAVAVGGMELVVCRINVLVVVLLLLMHAMGGKPVAGTRAMLCAGSDKGSLCCCGGGDRAAMVFGRLLWLLWRRW
jgi:hypothetical protein